MRVEQATIDDVPALSDLLSILFLQEAEFAPDPRAQREGLAKIIGDGEAGVILVARRDARVVGMVALLFTISTALGGQVALLEDMVVAPDCRSAGCGKKLLTAAVSVARDRGCKRITLLTDRLNEAAQRFYERQGFTLSTMVPMRLSLVGT